MAIKGRRTVALRVHAVVAVASCKLQAVARFSCDYGWRVRKGEMRAECAWPNEAQIAVHAIDHQPINQSTNQPISCPNDDGDDPTSSAPAPGSRGRSSGTRHIPSATRYA